MDEQQKHDAAENPETFTGLKKGSIKKVAAGIPAVISSIEQTFGKAGVLRGWKALFNLNKKGGFDCPSCAWPEKHLHWRLRAAAMALQ